MNVLVDTNVVVSAVIHDGVPRRVVEAIVGHDDWFWIVTDDIEKEYRDVLARPKFKIPSAVQQSFSDFIETVTIRVQPLTSTPFPRDPKDAMFIDAALASDADYLITGDKDLLDLKRLSSTQILNPAEFARLFQIS